MIDPTKLTADKGVTMEREAGWYWVYVMAGWQCAQYFGGYWAVTFSEDKWYDEDFHTIGPRIEEPEDE